MKKLGSILFSLFLFSLGAWMTFSSVYAYKYFKLTYEADNDNLEVPIFLNVKTVTEELETILLEGNISDLEEARTKFHFQLSSMEESLLLLHYKTENPILSEKYWRLSQVISQIITQEELSFCQSVDDQKDGSPYTSVTDLDFDQEYFFLDRVFISGVEFVALLNESGSMKIVPGFDQVMLPRRGIKFSMYLDEDGLPVVETY